MLGDLWAGRGLAWRLFLRDTAALYRQSILGYVWAFLPPLATTATFVFLREQQVLVIAETPIAYAAYVMMGTVLWQTFVDAMNSPLRSVTANKGILVRVSFPREALILAGVLEVLFNFLIRFLVLIPLFWIFEIPLTSSILLFPIALLALIALGLCFGVLITPLGLLYSDVGRGLGMITTFWMFLTPVVYPPPASGLAARLATLNPATPIIVTARDWLTAQPAMHLTGFVVVTVAALSLLLVGWLLYHVALPHLIERMGG
jgi:lipopolysaccharide transport system permease protein